MYIGSKLFGSMPQRLIGLYVLVVNCFDSMPQSLIQNFTDTLIENSAIFEFCLYFASGFIYAGRKLFGFMPQRLVQNFIYALIENSAIFTKILC